MKKQSNEKRSAQMQTLRRVLRYIRPHRGVLLLALLLNLLTVALTLLLPILVGRGIDCIAGPGQVRLEELARLLAGIIACIAGTALLQWLAGILVNRLTYHTVRDIRADAFEMIQRLPLSFLDARPVGDTVSRMITDVDTFADGLLMGFTQLFSGVLTILGTLGFMCSLSPLIAALVVLLTPISLLVARFIARRTFSMFQQQSVTRGEQTALLNESIENQKVILAFSHGDETLAQFDEVNERLGKCSLRATFFSSLVNPSTRFVNSLVYAAVALAGGLTVLSGGGLTIGGLTSFLSYANQYTKPFNEISGVVTELQNALACAGRIFSLMDEQPMTPEPEAGWRPAEVHGAFDLSHLRFSYDPSRPLIRDLNLHAAPGMRVAIVGPSGCGKTTLINLLMRFYDPDGGIAMDGVNTLSIPRGDLRRQIGMVLQETWLPAGTIREIISFGKPEATEEEIIAAAKAAHAHSYIRRLPEGYDTFIQENGGALSEGQRQLLCIARVMLRLPPVLILDEATSSIDIRTEQRIQRAFDEMMRGRTSFVVAHRLSTIQGADTILVMRDGDVVEQGDHASLLEANGFYARLYKAQFEN